MAASGRTRVAMIGCGFFSRNHLMAWGDLAESEVVGVCDRDPERAAWASALGGAPAFTDAAAMLDVIRPDVADIAAPAPAHLPLVRLCAERGIAAIVQKPLAMTLAECAAIARVAREAGITVKVHENFRFQRPIRETGRIVASGEIGEPRYARVGFRIKYKVFPREPSLRAGERVLLMDMGVHVLDTARFLMGEIGSVSCRTQSLADDTPGDDMASVLVGFESGAMGLVEASAETRLPWDPGAQTLLSIEGREGAVVLERDFRISVRGRNGVRRFRAEPPDPAWNEIPNWRTVSDSVIETCRNWLDAERGRAPLETDIEDNLMTMAAVEACYRSAAADGAPFSPAEVLAEVQEG